MYTQMRDGLRIQTIRSGRDTVEVLRSVLVSFGVVVFVVQSEFGSYKSLQLAIMKLAVN